MFIYELDADTSLTGPIYLTKHIISVYKRTTTSHIVYSHDIHKWILIRDYPYTQTILSSSQINLTSTLKVYIMLIYIICFLKVLGLV